MQRALIVDDSKTAQVRLRKMLSRYDLAVDIVSSAEEALGYLSYRMPAVVFMDHHMEGMDGFEALKIIKANPNTATIPVIMYTSQKGDVYVGQARALGALDILSKEIIKPSSLERVLACLHIVPKGEAEDSAVATKPVNTVIDPVSMPAEKPHADLPPANDEDPVLVKVQTQVAKLFEMHIADVRQQIADNSRFIVRRLSGELEKNQKTEPTIDDVPVSVLNAELTAENRRGQFISSSLLFLIFIGLGLIAWELYDSKRDNQFIKQQYSQLMKLNTDNQALISSLTEYLSAQETEHGLDGVDPAVMDVVSWALENNMHFDYGTQPLGEEQIVKLNALTYQLAAAGFTGLVELDIHFGNFCVQMNSAGDWVLAAPETLVQNCVLVSDLNREYQVGDYLSMPFLGYEQNAQPIKEGRISVSLGVSGLAQPKMAYPEPIETVTAGQWNAIAAQNNRISVGFSYL